VAEPGPLTLADAAATHEAGRRLGAALRTSRPGSLVVFLEGDLGAGKTTLARGFLESLGHVGRVPSPTYTLVEPYQVGGYRVCHVDLYRIRSPAEIEDIDLAGQLGPGSVALIEWPERGAGHLPAPDLRVALELAGTQRRLRFRACSPAGESLLHAMGTGAG
jgi:tRNA threonylcarbamoyladenosine biosynthesis protein TsaE